MQQPSHRELLAASLFVVAVLLACGHSDKANVTAAADIAPAEPAKPAPVAPEPQAVTPAKIGDAVGFTDSSWIVEKAEKIGSVAKSNNQFQPDMKSDGGFFVRVIFKVTNLGKTEERLFQPPKLMDAQGRQFNEISNLVFYIPEGKHSLMLEAIPPSLPKEFWSVYEVAGNATGLRFLARELSATGSVYPVDLALK